MTILGERVNYAQKTLTIEDPQIVNGLQTSRSIHNYFSESDTSADNDRQLLVRVIQSSDDEVSAQIIKATNSQNRVPSASLHAAEPFQRDIEEYLLRKGLYYERRRNHYKIKASHAAPSSVCWN